MKKLNAFLIALALLVGTAVPAAIAPSNGTTDPATAEIRSLLENPGFLVKEEMTASVSFVVNKDNEIVILSIDSSSMEVENFITERLSHHKLETVLRRGREYTVPIMITSES